MREEFVRVDLPVRVESREDGRQWTVGSGEFAREISAEAPPPELFASLPPEAFRQESPAAKIPPQVLSRVVLSLDLESAHLDAESLLQPLLPAIPFPSVGWSPRLVVRHSEAQPRFAATNFKVPLRLLQLDAISEHPLRAWIREVFGRHTDAAVDKAVVVQTGRLGEDPPAWPVIDVLHLDTWPDRPAKELLTNDATHPGTLGWFARWTGAWQTRLLAIHCATESQAAAARILAQRLCEKGGPAVLIGPPAAPEIFWRALYDRLIHDDPLDLALDRAASTIDKPGALYASGWQRAEGVRVSGAGTAVVDLNRHTPASTPHMARFAHDWNAWHYSLHEADGLIPMAAALVDLRAHVEPSFEVVRGEERRARPEERFVNAAFFGSGPGAPERLDPGTGPLRTGVRYELGVQIGPQQRETAPVNAQAILEEIFEWSVHDKGVWVEIGVVGLDFNVEGDPVQPLWLPREGPSSTVYFGVRTAASGAVQLRYGLYYGNNLIQSFRVAACAAASEEAAPPDASTLLAGALEVPPERVRGFYQARMEYSRTSAFSALKQESARALSVVAGRLRNKVVLSTKTTEGFETVVTPDNGTPRIVQAIRTRLNAIAYGPTNQYRFGPSAPDPDGLLSEALRSLAKEGYRLYTSLARSEPARQALHTAVNGTGKVIQIAPLLRDIVVPWAFVYDRDFDDGAQTWKGKPIQQGVCLAPWKSGALDLETCGASDECLLGDKVRKEREAAGLPAYHERFVVCPRGFWGFRHSIEAPVQQAGDGPPEEEASSIVPSGDFRLVAGFNQQLATAATHWNQLCGARKWPAPSYDRDEILERLRDPDLDFVYFFCHARGGELDDPSIDPPYLEFQPSGAGTAQFIEPQHLADPVLWEHRPLVFLNACGTLGYSPDAHSPFLKALVEGRGAAGVLGTEIPVPEVLAGEVACAFIRRFVAGVPAGQALLEAKRDLLAKKNPLGLVYTLYASAELAVDTEA